MNTSEFTSLLKEPCTITLAQTNAIEGVLENYPYFQAARILHLKGLRNQHSYKYNATLKTAAAYTTNRTVLFDFITADMLDASNAIEKQQQLIIENEVIDVEVVKKPLVSSPVNTIETKTEIIKEKLEIGKPLVFDLAEMHSFSEWLQLTHIKPIERKETVKTTEPKLVIQKSAKKEDKFDLIEQFIISKPKLKPPTTIENIDVSFESIKEDNTLMTETLARVYLEQRKYNKAIQAFKILSLKYPEKSSFFADRIKAIKFLQKNNS
jgi:hypothetical protein